jgi:hypothetical protein
LSPFCEPTPHKYRCTGPLEGQRIGLEPSHGDFPPRCLVSRDHFNCPSSELSHRHEGGPSGPVLFLISPGHRHRVLSSLAHPFCSPTLPPYFPFPSANTSVVPTVLTRRYWFELCHGLPLWAKKARRMITWWVIMSREIDPIRILPVSSQWS